jgi:putative transposase
VSFIDAHQDRFGGVEPICRVLSEHGWQIAPSGYWAAKARPTSARDTRDDQLVKVMYEIRGEDYNEVYGARKMWRELGRRGHRVARCTVERLMRREGLSGAVRGRHKVRTTVADPSHPRAPDRLRRDFSAPAPNRVWVADFTEVVAWAGIVYVAFVVDVYSRAIVGWAAATSKAAPLVVNALKMAVWRRDHDGHAVQKGLIHHSDAGSQYTSTRFVGNLRLDGIDASIGTVGDALDNALMESTIGLYKTELIKRRGPWRTLADVELGTAQWIEWYNARRLHSAIGHVPPNEYEAAYYTSMTEPGSES